MKTKNKPGRTPVIKKIILSNCVQMQNRNDVGMVEFLMEKTPVRKFMAGGENGDLNKQKKSLYIQCYTERRKLLKEGKKVEFKGGKWFHNKKNPKSGNEKV